MVKKTIDQLHEFEDFMLPNKRVKKGRIATKKYDVDYIEELARNGCAVYEIAALCGFNVSYFHELKKKDASIQEAIDRGKANLHKSLRKKQVELALDGSVPLLIHLGKTELGQTDRIEVNQNLKAEVEYEVKFGEAIEKGDQATEASSSSSDSSE